MKYRCLLIVCLLFISCSKKNDDSKVNSILDSVCTTTNYENIKKELFSKIISSKFLFENHNDISAYTLSGQYKSNCLSLVSIKICDKYAVILCDQSKNNYSIKDLVIVDDLKNETLVLNGCEYNGSKDDDIIAIASNTDNKYLGNVRKAWKINREEYIIQEIKVDSIRCLNEEYGL